MSLCGRFIVPYFYLITFFYSSQNKSNYPSVMLHYATAVRGMFISLTLPSSSALVPLCGSVPSPQWSITTPSKADFKLLLEPWLVEERAKEPSLSAC